MVIVLVWKRERAGTKKAASGARRAIKRASSYSKPSSPPRLGARAQTSDDGETVSHAREDDEMFPGSQWSIK
jgi:hypothetical protein